MKVKIKRLTNDAKVPTRGSDRAAGYDVYASETPLINEHTKVITIKTGIALQPPKGWYFKLHPRSSCSKYRVALANSTGIIDNDYTGEVILKYYVVGGLAYTGIQKGDRVGQLVLDKYYDVDFVEVDDLTTTKRGKGGFGSSGVR